MQFLIDESRLFDFPKTREQTCKLSVVAAAILPYMSRKKRNALHKRYHDLDKACTLDDVTILEILDDLISIS